MDNHNLCDQARENGPSGHKTHVIIKKFNILGFVQNNYVLSVVKFCLLNCLLMVEILW